MKLRTNWVPRKRDGSLRAGREVHVLHSAAVNERVTCFCAIANADPQRMTAIGNQSSMSSVLTAGDPSPVSLPPRHLRCVQLDSFQNDRVQGSLVDVVIL